ncbi:sigma-70 family RNA polymerase sigma factor [Methylotenera sp.]|uniref:sigma-70 family RNA polymerase sigma factor n=1 Tax=Methylotenera sp. TaxID=2051956 RepID=UPI002486CF8E|nr:sigma-70 family RNA polymerase sigma factor [Methylotenera sp.]MDI1360511.1 sigma-70 family RNA polymerase sigma factor [Methylotenera sp.]
MNLAYSKTSLTPVTHSLHAILASKLSSNDYVRDIQLQDLSSSLNFNIINDATITHIHQIEPNKVNHEFVELIVAMRPMLERVARLKLRNSAWAEDAVSDTIVAALERPSAYSGRSMMRTWLVGILKNKIVDQIRRHTRECQSISFEDDVDISDFMPTNESIEDDLQAKWSNPEESLSKLQFIAKLNLCLKEIPVQQANAFILKYALDKDTDEICDELSITTNNLNVMLHRTKVQLRISMQVQYL